jgi:TPR repeat protein
LKTDPVEQYARAIRLLNGDGVPKDERAGYELLLEAASAGVADAAYEAAQCARLGRGTAPDKKLAYGLYRVGAERGHGPSAFSAAMLLGQGVLGAPDYAQAVDLYEIAAKADHAPAAHNLGIMYAKGVGVRPDAAKAREHLTRAVSLGFDQALFSLGLLCLMGGENLKPDPVEALKWALLSQRRDAGGPGSGLVERASAACGAEQRAEARRRAEAWRPAGG